MNYLEFKRQLMVDPYERSAEFEAALRDDKQCAEAAAESEKFEQALRAAIDIEVPEDIVVIAQQQAWRKTSIFEKATGWMPAVAAGLIMGVGLTSAVFFYNNAQGPDINAYLANHWSMDGMSGLQQAASQQSSPADVKAVLATLSLEADDNLMEHIMHARNCGTPNGKGVHMVVHTDDGMVTVIYMPGMRTKQGEIDAIDGNHVMLTRLEHGSIAYLGESMQSLKTAETMVEAHLSKTLDT